MRLLPFLLVIVLAAGCGGPLCDDPDEQAAFVNSCVAPGGVSTAYCICTFDYLADRHACDDFDSVTIAEITDAVAACL